MGGGIIAGTAEMVYTPSIGLVGSASMLLAYASSFIIGEMLTLTFDLCTQSIHFHTHGHNQDASPEFDKLFKSWAMMEPEC